MTENEKFVRKHWEWVVVRKRDDRPEWEWFGSLLWKMNSHIANSEEECWTAVAEYTRGWLEKIQQVEEEIAWVGSLHNITHIDAATRVFRRLESVLANLKKGMKS